ncbi:MAG: hypothetical protein K0S36_1546 [Nitrosospira multiformis]|nr:hypothetical protein [Nitrosospira multiformis]
MEDAISKAIAVSHDPVPHAMSKRRYFRIGIQNIESHAFARLFHDAHMLALQLTGMAQAAGVDNHIDFPVHVFGIIGNAQVFLLHHQTPLQTPIMGGDTSRAGIRVTSHGLDTAE